MSERDEVIDHVMLAASRMGGRLFRNNQGVGQMPDGSKVKFGVGDGGSDMIGWTRLVVTPQMVGQTVAVFTAVEAKTGLQKPTKKQNDFIQLVEEHGGIGMWGNDPELIRVALEGVVRRRQEGK